MIHAHCDKCRPRVRLRSRSSRMSGLVKRQAPTSAFVIFLAVLACARPLLGFWNGHQTIVASLFLLLGFILVGYVIYTVRRSKTGIR